MTPSRSAAPVVGGDPALRALSVSKSVDFEIPAAGGQVSLLGLYTLTFPAAAVCDPSAQNSRDGYAAQAWDAPCTSATGNVAVRATLKWSSGALWIDFAPALRFVPGKTVTIHTDILAPVVRYFGSSAASSGLARQWGIGYAQSIEGSVSDEAKSDPSLKSRIDLRSGRISRQIKHFSGYFIATGPDSYEPCEPSENDPYCIWYDIDMR